MVDRVPDDRLRTGMRHRRETIERETESLPLHSEFIARTCAAPQVVAV
jgi:hypothetical protein